MLNSVKLTFVLTKEQSGPFPVSTESLWCDRDNGNFRVKNIPFFIDGISFDDVITVSGIGEDTYQITSVFEPSGNSTIWLYFKDEAKGMILIDSLRNMGCGLESGIIKNYYAVNVPFNIEINQILALLDDARKENWLITDYPSIRHRISG